MLKLVWSELPSWVYATVQETAIEIKEQITVLLAQLVFFGLDGFNRRSLLSDQGGR